jgi:hypothetical protein
MKNKHVLLLVLALILGGVVAFSTGASTPDVVTAARGEPGPPPGKGGGGGAPDYGDLIVIHRDEYGVPIPSPAVQVQDPETGLLVDGGLCWQPVAAEASEDLDFLFAGEYDDNGDPVYTADRRGIPVDQYTCGVEAEFATLTQEVEFGRINEARSPDDVFASQLEDVVTKLAIADTTSLDPAGRMVASTCSRNVFATSTIDSPLQSLAVYRQLMLTGTIGPPLPQGADWLDTAARALGTASDKTGGVTVDMVAYLNMIMGLDEATTVLPKRCVTLREEVKGTIQEVQKCFLDFSAFGYDRAANFGALPLPAYIPELDPQAGWFEHLAETSPGIFQIVQGPTMDAVFGEGFVGDNVGGFARASDDTRAVINFMHANPVLDAYVTPVPCAASGDTFVDVSISDVSGLQVPKNVVDGSSDREFIVTVANAGPDDATVALTVTATPAVDGTVMANLGEGFVPSPFVFPETAITAGSSHAFSALISVDIGERTTIDWTAEATTVETDVNETNNAVTAVSNVKVTRGGGGGH